MAHLLLLQLVKTRKGPPKRGPFFCHLGSRIGMVSEFTLTIADKNCSLWRADFRLPSKLARKALNRALQSGRSRCIRLPVPMRQVLNVNLKHVRRDIPLQQVDFAWLDTLCDHFKNRPPNQKDGKTPLSPPLSAEISSGNSSASSNLTRTTASASL